MANRSPMPLPRATDILYLNFYDALKEAMKGKRITRKEWDDKRFYGLFKDDMLMLHKAGENAETLHAFLIRKVDVESDDWYVLETTSVRKL